MAMTTNPATNKITNSAGGRTVGWQPRTGNTTNNPGGALGGYGGQLGQPPVAGSNPNVNYNDPYWKQQTQTPTPQTPSPYTPPPNTGMGTTPTTNTDIYNSADANYIRNLPTAYTPEQQLLMKNSATDVAAAGQRGTNDKIREAMAAMGTGGGGGEIGTLTNSMIGGNQALGQNLSNIDVSNANAGLQGGFAKAGLLNSLMGTGMDQNRLNQNQNQFNTSQYNDLYKWGNETDYQRQLDRMNTNDYDSQMKLFLQMLGIG
jgi:hypothetical protein